MVVQTKIVKLLRFAWNANRIDLFEFGNSATPVQFYFVRGDLIAFRFPLEAVSGTVKESLYILNNANLDHHKKRRAALSIEKIDDTYLVDKTTFDRWLNVLNTRIALGFDYVTAPTVSERETDSTGRNVLITFNKAMLPPQDLSEFKVVINGGVPVTPIMGAIADEVTQKQFQFLLPESATIKSGDTVTIAYTAGTVLAADGGVLASFTAAAVTDKVLIPEVVSIETDATGEKIQITFTKTMAAPGSNAEDDFSILIEGGTAFAPTSVTAHATDTKIIELNLATADAIVAADSVTLSYDGETIKSSDNGVLVAFTDFPVKNNVT